MSENYLSPQQRSKLKQEIIDILVYQAGRKQKITYNELCNRITTTRVVPSDSLLYDLLGEISAESSKLKKGMLSVIVVKKETQLPGKGFFTLAKTLGYEIDNRESFVNSQIELVHNHYRDNDMLTI